jgi:hypothetical protein
MIRLKMSGRCLDGMDIRHEGSAVDVVPFVRDDRYSLIAAMSCKGKLQATSLRVRLGLFRII